MSKLSQHIQKLHICSWILKNASLIYETKYFRLIIQSASPNGCPGCIKMDHVKIHAVDAWKSLRTVKNVQGFLGFANFYQHFIKNFARLSFSLTTLISKDRQLHQLSIKKIAFQAIKSVFSSATVLHHFDPNKAYYIMEIGASNYVSGATFF